ITGKTTDPGYPPEPFAFGSKPTGNPKDYPPLKELEQRFKKSINMLADAVKATSEEGLKKSVPWGATSITVRDLALRMVFHNGTHCGQMAATRRALGMEKVIKAPPAPPAPGSAQQPLGTGAPRKA